MTSNRQGEGGGDIPKRSPRVFQKSDGHWYFMTREATEVGPFQTDEAATAGVNDYAGFAQDADKVYFSDAVHPVGDGLTDLFVQPAAPTDDATVVLPADRATDNSDTDTASGRQWRQFSSRIFVRENAWFFFTREGREMGPFASRADAQDGLEKYVAFAKSLEQEIQSAYQEDPPMPENHDDDLFS